MDILLKLQNWYKSECDGMWEHGYGIDIGTLDNPGWHVKVDLIGTNLESKHFEEINTDNSVDDWIICKIENKKFIGYGDSQKLKEILQIFLEWAIK